MRNQDHTTSTIPRRRQARKQTSGCSLTFWPIIASAVVFLVNMFMLTEQHDEYADVEKAHPSLSHMGALDTFTNDSIANLRAVDIANLRATDRRLHNHIPPILEHETILGTLMGALIRESQAAIVELIPSDGSFLDAGMQFGEFGAHMAVNAPSREVVMLDPSPSNVEAAKRAFGGLSNVQILQGGLGAEVGSMKARDETFNMETGAEFPVYTIDSLFYEAGKKLAFAHLDVEGFELNVLKGASKTINQSKPIFTTEVRVHKDVEFTKALLDFIFDLGYDSYVINEVCGFPHMDFRNLLNIPRSLSSELKFSDTFLLLDATRSIYRVPPPKEGQKMTIFDIVLPCCTLGGECCPVNNADDEGCCSEERVLKWLDTNKPGVNPYFYTWKGARREVGRIRYRVDQRQHVMPH